MFDHTTMSREQLDAEYDLRARHPDTDEHIELWTRLSAEARGALECTIDISYGSTAGEKLDVFHAREPGSPVLIFIHGGYWQRMDKSEHSFPASGFVPAGCAVVSVNYDLAPSVPMDEIVRQARAAVAWVCQNTEAIGGDPNQIYVAGHSAGGHLAAMVVSAESLQDYIAPKGGIRGVCSISGLFDLEPMRFCYQNDVLALDEESARRNSPLHNIPLCGVSMIAAVGGGETLPFLYGTESYISAWKAAGNSGEALILPGLHHFEIVTQLADSSTPLSQAILRQMGK